METIVNAIVKKCSGLAYEAAITVLGVKDELEKLLLKIESIRYLLEDAEKKRYHERFIHLWLFQLKDVLYDADDIIDLCMIKGNQLLAGDENCENEEIFRVCCIFFSIFTSISSICLRYRIGKKIKDLNARLQTIYENRTQFNLQPRSETPQAIITQVNTIQTFPSMDPLIVVEGELEVATNDLVNLLTDEKAEEKCRLFAIAGMGGIGKTTLAQNIFKHPKIKGCFSDSKVWVCVSQTYNEIELLKAVIRGVKGNYANDMTKAELIPILGNSVASCRRLFLVLDDVWKADVWFELLRIPLQTSNSLVRVLVTTRNADNFANEAAHIHNVMGLSEDASWDMLRRLLFKDGHEEQQQANDLKELGLKILEKCGGLPLAIKAIAGVLRTREKTTTAWEQILRSDTWSVSGLHEDHIAALHLSYEDLPSHLKQCFLYFSLYGEDVEFKSRELARLWVAEGFLTENHGNSLNMEDVAESYFHELLGRNLLLFSYSDRGGGTVCKMHDIVRSLAIFLSKEETSCGDVNVKNSFTLTKLRRLSVANKRFGEATEIVDLVAKKGALRTLLARHSDLSLDDETLRRLSCLRVLDISRCFAMQKLPDSIGNLVHLRYLDLSSTDITAIPESIKHLAYLQFLNLYHCQNLEKLPGSIGNLVHLRHLDLSWTNINAIPESIKHLAYLQFLNLRCCRNLKELPDSIGNLVHLRHLDLSWTNINAIPESIKHLAYLQFWNLESCRNLKELPDSIGNLVHLRHLDLSWTNINAIPESIKHLAYLQFLNLNGCFELIQLPNGITQLHNLRYLNLRFTNISFMPKGIEKLQQLNCLRGFPVDNMDSSSKLVDLNSLKQLRSLHIQNITGDQSDVVLLEELPHLSKLTLDISFGVPAEVFDKIIPPRSLKTLKIISFDGPRFPNWMALSSFENHLPNLTVLELRDIELCTQLPPLGQLRELRKLTIDNASNVMRIGQELLGDGVVTSTIRIAFPKLEEFFISYLNKLEDWSFGAQVEESASPRLKLLPCLHELEISHFGLLKQLPKGLKYSAMKSLKLLDNPNLEKVCQLAMLKELHIYKCPSLSSVEQLDSLQRLYFEDEQMESLPVWLLILLQQRVLQNDTNKDFLLELICTKKVIQECLTGGSYWDLIQHIPRVTAEVTFKDTANFGSYLRYEKQPYVYNTNM